MLWEKINAKPFVTIFFFKIFGKTGSFDVLICYAVSLRKPVLFNAKIRPTTLNLVQNWISLLPASENNYK